MSKEEFREEGFCGEVKECAAFRCPLCKTLYSTEEYSERGHVPLVLPCGHCICSDCARKECDNKWQNSEDSDDEPIDDEAYVDEAPQKLACCPKCGVSYDGKDTPFNHCLAEAMIEMDEHVKDLKNEKKQDGRIDERNERQIPPKEASKPVEKRTVSVEQGKKKDDHSKSCCSQCCCSCYVVLAIIFGVIAVVIAGAAGLFLLVSPPVCDVDHDCHKPDPEDCYRNCHDAGLSDLVNLPVTLMEMVYQYLDDNGLTFK